MTPDRTRNERISAWLLEEAPEKLPDWVFDAAFDRIRAEPRRRAIPGRRHYPMTRIPAVIAVGAAGVLILAVGAIFVSRSGPFVGGTPTSTPTGSPIAVPSATTAATATSDASPTLAPVSARGQIAFQRTVDGNTDLYLMNLDRTGLVRLTSDPAPDNDPGWSPDGQRMIFTRSVAGAGDVFVVNADGSGETRLTNTPEDEHEARFSPDGSSIAFWRGDDQNGELRLMDADGSNERAILAVANMFAAGVTWTADGRAILFNRDMTGGGGIDIVHGDIASGAVTPISDDPGDDSGIALSPDGTTIAFQSDRSPGGIFLMDVDGTNVRHLIGTWDKGYPTSWSPDGQYLAYSQPDRWISLVRVDGTDVTRWAEGGSNLAWRPTP